MGIKADKRVLREETLCKVSEGEYHRNDCLKRVCNKCSTHKIRGHLQLIEDLCSKDNITIDWYKWEYMMVHKHDCDDNSKKRTRTVSDLTE